MLGDGVVDVESAQPREGWCWPNLKGQINQRPTCLKDNPKETWCRCAAALNPGLPAKSCLQESKAFQKAKPYTFQMYWTIHFEEGIVTEKPFTQESFAKNNLRVERQNTFPNPREGDKTRGDFWAGGIWTKMNKYSLGCTKMHYDALRCTMMH